MGIKRNIINFMEERLYKPMLKEELATQFGLEGKEINAFYKVLEEMEKEGVIIKTRNDRYGLIHRMNLVVGRLEGNEKGFGFLVPDDKEKEDIFIPAEEMNGAIHGDRVVVRIISKGTVDRKDEGEVIRILERANETLVGTYESSKNFGFVIPDDSRIAYDVFIPKDHANGAKTNQKVVVEITRWPEKRRNPEGKIIDILGYVGEKGVDILSIIKQYKLPEEFPEKVEEQAKRIEQTVKEEDIKNRVDLKDLNTFTIDGADAKDLDDAVSIEKVGENYRLGVHIADVSHYVPERSPLDKEAYKRGNSVYLVDRVIPMLPKELSNGICSLNPNVDRLTLSIFMEIDRNGNVVDHEIVEGVIRSKARLVYDDVSDLLENDNYKAFDKLDKIVEDLKLMEELSHILYERREGRGSIDFDFPEARIILDEEGVPVDIVKEDRRIANRMIEEFMLVCNETIAEYMYWSEVPFLYRVHEEPDMEKINSFNKFVHNFGYMIKGTQEVHPKELQRLTKEVKGKKEETLINTLLLRSLKKARYSSEPDIHFGLAAKYYSHYTAPIRRYPDLQIHRILKSFYKGKLNPQEQAKLEAILPKVAEHTSITERTAEEAERAVDDLKVAEYMSKRIGNIYEGIVSSLTHFGMYVQLENTVEGLVHFSNMLDDYYEFDEDNYYIIGEFTRKKYKLGDTVRIKVIKADLVKRTVDFMLLS
ncbi:Ribonuclease R [[Clostridium] ultunense Esp]|uniref:Ribonuclease R n=1 Tax=[Clostridium] ultunense Esp TaxID=1288971 RepID=M1ZB91_9FIRM|nr:ribonuclease R [Schnuerera ultunensis]CCQ95219.1 Ribonuclease R [[Clostridium] ultunense Esp]SHD75894.1 ribonuclease R [[Clostridium] ultunense Esp]